VAGELARPEYCSAWEGLTVIFVPISPDLECYYIQITTSHVAAHFEKFVAYSERGTAEGIAAAFPPSTNAVR
jgi:hypothetical protein